MSPLPRNVSLNFSGAKSARVVHANRELAVWPGEILSATIPLNAAGVVILVYVVFRGRQFDPWLRLVGAAALAQHAVALFYMRPSRATIS